MLLCGDLHPTKQQRSVAIVVVSVNDDKKIYKIYVQLKYRLKNHKYKKKQETKNNLICLQ